MAKKRKHSDRRPLGHKEFDDKDGKLGPIRSYQDVADSEDEFHINRDKILLDEGPEAKRRRKIEEEDALLEPSDEEILGYSDDEDEEGDEEYDDDEGETEIESSGGRGAEVLGASEEEEGDEDAGDWGSSKKDYYDADNIETEVDALEEEAEAKRLQQKKLQKMSEADFGFDESEWLDADNDEDKGDIVTEVLKDMEITADMSTAERLSLLRRRYPEFESLANEYLQLKPLLEDLQIGVDGMPTSEVSGQNSFRLALAKYRALAAYVGALAMYFAVLTSTAQSNGGKQLALEPIELRDHSIMESLLQCRELWSKVKDLQATVEIDPQEDLTITVDNLKTASGNPSSPPQQPDTKKTKKENALEKAAAEALKSRNERIRAAEVDVQDLVSLLPNSKQRSKPATAKSASAPANSDSDFGEEETLSKRAFAEKSAKKKSLRFYTSQIAQKANRRADAGRDAGGDADLPYRERLRDRQARLNAEAEKRGKKLDEYGRGGVALGGDDSGHDDDVEIANAVRENEDGYYDMVAQTSRAKKDEKAERYATIAAAKAANSQIRVVEGEVGEDGKRAIGYVIEKNKGLAPRRKKDVRNPRVKKRKMYEEKKKKLSSVRAVYKGGEERGGYGGEKTGIKTGLVKSIKL